MGAVPPVGEGPCRTPNGPLVVVCCDRCAPPCDAPTAPTRGPLAYLGVVSVCARLTCVFKLVG